MTIVTNESITGVPRSSNTRVLKATTGSLQRTGGTEGTKTTLLEVPLTDGWLSDPTVRLVIEYAANYTNSANTKNYGPIS